jgi:hypothetical protein
MKTARNGNTQIKLSAEAAVEGLSLTWDLARMSMHAAEAKRAVTLGVPAPTAPAPISKLLRRFSKALLETMSAIEEHLSPTERERLTKLKDGFARAVYDSDPDVVEMITKLMPFPPEVVALWIRLELPRLEERFAS